MKTETTFEIEITRHNVTAAQFLSYVRARVDAKGGRMCRSDLDLDYFKRGDDLNYDTKHEGDPDLEGIHEKSISKPYEMQTYIRYPSGATYNEICEWNDGTGYYYLVNIVAIPEAEDINTTDGGNDNAPAEDTENEKGESTVTTTKNTTTETRQEQTDRENREHCQRIAEEIEAVADGNCYRCPKCGEIIRWDNDQYNDEEATYTCPECGEEFDESDLEPFCIYDYFDDVFDIEYRINGNREYKSVRLMVACGGPNIYIDTAERAVMLYWWTDRAQYPLSRSACDAIDAEFEELFNC